jgi:hypothetical protein
VLSGNKGRVLSASNSMATWKRRRLDQRTTAPQARRPPTHRPPSGPASTCYTVPVELCIRFTQTTHDDRRRRVRVLGDGPSARTKSTVVSDPLPMIRSCSTCVV